MVNIVLWLTGLPSSGKTTLARRLRDILIGSGYGVEVLESDEYRRMLTPNPSYTDYERDLFYRSIVVTSYYLYRNGLNVIIDATGHKRSYRDYARRIIRDFIEVYVYAPLKVCMDRDVKGLYRLAVEGIVKTLPGLQVPYEEPARPEVRVNTHIEDVDESIAKIIRYLVDEYDFSLT